MPSFINLFKYRQKVYFNFGYRKKKESVLLAENGMVSRGSRCAGTIQLQVCCSLAVSTAAPQANTAPLSFLRDF